MILEGWLRYDEFMGWQIVTYRADAPPDAVSLSSVLQEHIGQKIALTVRAVTPARSGVNDERPIRLDA